MLTAKILNKNTNLGLSHMFALKNFITKNQFWGTFYRGYIYMFEIPTKFSVFFNTQYDSYTAVTRKKFISYFLQILDHKPQKWKNASNQI
jgi:hypothetical protein